MGPQQDRKSSMANGTVSSRKETKVVQYRECQRNHAAAIGGYAVDGCREFMASGAEGTAAALMCAACACHRSFHRREQVEADYDCSSTTSS
ncbi:hypothetical protein HU200_064572 [Digitaria exilis]|uniref:ZF-HD dimerization-type domain-containing protein n=1 Tax=Digitaria exilis TaxID=1010633 RepID=A0A835A1G3_9POAL|nr:hypothetical protein HU200_064572 [Digitaria exilis]CAB3490781.1 unnamed protein product [Digitaria exilis]